MSNATEPLALSRNLAWLRGRLGVSQTVLAAVAGVHQTQVSKLERGDVADPAVSVLVRLARALDVTVEALLGEPEGLERMVSRAETDRRAAHADADDVLDQVRRERRAEHAAQVWSLVRDRIARSFDDPAVSFSAFVTDDVDAALVAARDRLGRDLCLRPDGPGVSWDARWEGEAVVVDERSATHLGRLLDLRGGVLRVRLAENPASPTGWTVTAIAASDEQAS